MTAIRLPRRAIVCVGLSTTLLGAGLAAFAEDAPAGCPPTYTDPAADSGLLDPGTNPAVGDDDLDIVAVTHSVDGAAFTSSVKVVELYDSGPNLAFGDRFATVFTVAGKEVEVTAERDFSGAGTNEAYVAVDGTEATFPVKLVEDVKASTISAVMAAADLEKAVGSALADQAFTKMSASARAIYLTNGAPNVGVLWDEATAPETATYKFGAGCGAPAAAPASGTPTPAPSSSASPQPSASASPTPAPSGSPSTAPGAGAGPLSDYPAGDCATKKDPKGDATYNNAPNDPDLDITAYTLRTTADALVAYLKVDQLGEQPTVTPFDGHRFYSDFTFNKHVFTVAASSFASYGSSVREGAAQTGQVGPMAAMTMDSEGTGGDPGFTDAKVTAKFDPAASMVVLSVPLADIEKNAKAELKGATLTAVAGRSGADTGVLILPHDTTASETPEKDVYVIGDNPCFAPPPKPLTSVGAAKAQFGDVAAVAAKLVDAAGAPVAGKAVTFALGRTKARATTGADGVAKASLPVREKAGRRSLVLTSDSTTAKVPFTVLVEKVVLKATGSGGTVTATMVDDDRKPVAGQVVTFTSGSRKATARTNAKGIAKVGGFPAGSTVQVAYAGATGMYSRAATSAKA